ncbi:MAG: hypothetical protein ACLP7J_18725 [Streptosporangiaceae bacterium]
MYGEPESCSFPANVRLVVLNELIDLVCDFPDWEIERHAGAWVATRRNGTTVRVLAAFTLGELRVRIDEAEMA